MATSQQINDFIASVLGNKKSQQEQAAEINAAAQRANVSREQIAQATGYDLDTVKQFLGPNIIGQKTRETPYQMYDKASDTYRYVDAGTFENWLNDIPLTPPNPVPGAPVYNGPVMQRPMNPDLDPNAAVYQSYIQNPQTVFAAPEVNTQLAANNEGPPIGDMGIYDEATHNRFLLDSYLASIGGEGGLQDLQMNQFAKPMGPGAYMSEFDALLQNPDYAPFINEYLSQATTFRPGGENQFFERAVIGTPEARQSLAEFIRLRREQLERGSGGGG